jgi:hypothetical protein
MRSLFLKILTLSGFLLAQPSLAAADDTGMLVGAGLGGLIGSTIGRGAGQLAATGAGVFVGGAIGSQWGRPSYNHYYGGPSYANSYGYSYDMFPSVSAYPSSYPSPYSGPNYVAPPELPTPQPVTYIDNGNYCRQYSQTIRIGNRVRESYGTACLQPDGSWHIVQ